MLPDELWPSLFLISLLVCVGILACLTLTVLSILLERRFAHQEETLHHHITEQDSPGEGYCTFDERSFNGAFDHGVPVGGKRKPATMFIIPRKFLPKKGGDKLHQPAMRGDGNGDASETRLMKPRRASTRTTSSDMTLDGGGMHSESLLDAENCTPTTVSMGGGTCSNFTYTYTGGHRDETASVASSSVAQAPTREQAREGYVHETGDEFMFDMSV
ncbi:hypothetical protein V8C37DRAFT_366058 [Trichoderma ceciliae]